LYNLLSNAIKFTPEAGPHFDQSGSDGYNVRISITDSGPGISPEHQDKYSRSSASWMGRLHERAKNGLGLAFADSLLTCGGYYYAAQRNR
jgi:signal transduction histidine kinase